MNYLKPLKELFSKMKNSNWIISVSAMMLVLGVMLTLSWMTKETRNSRFDKLPPEQRARIATGTLDLTQEYEKLLDEVKELREENTKFQNSVAKRTGQTRLLNESLQKTKLFAGLTELEGPGIEITLQDYRGPKAKALFMGDDAIHDNDVLKVVNELWNAGAEGISVNEQRVVIGTHFRCVGSVILIKNVKIAPPILIKAVGNAKTLLGAMNLPGGALDELRLYGHPNMVKINKFNKIILPAYSGSTNYQYSDLPEEEK